MLLWCCYVSLSRDIKLQWQCSQVYICAILASLSTASNPTRTETRTAAYIQNLFAIRQMTVKMEIIYRMNSAAVSNMFIYLFICLFVVSFFASGSLCTGYNQPFTLHQCVCLSVCLSIYPPIHPSIYTSIHPSIRPSIHPSIYLSI